MPSWKELNGKAKEKAQELNEKFKEWNEERRNRPVNKLLTLLTTEDIRLKILEAEGTDNPVRKINKLRVAGEKLEQKSMTVAANVSRIIEGRSRMANFKFMGKAYAGGLAAMAALIMIFVPPAILVPVIAVSIAVQPIALLSAAVLFAPGLAYLATNVFLSRIESKEKPKQLEQLLEQNPELDDFDKTLGFLKDRVYGGMAETQKNWNITEAFNALSAIAPPKRKEFLERNEILRKRLKDEKLLEKLIVPKKPKEIIPVTTAGLWKKAH